MGQGNTTIAPQLHELQLIDRQRQLYLNVRNQRTYVRHSAVLADIADKQHELDVYMFRRVNDQFVVSVDYCSSMKELELCSSCAELTYFIEQQQYTLFQKSEIPVQQGMTILVHVLQGFRILYEKFGYFTPNGRLVFFNQLHQPRVWVNEDLTVNRNLQCPHGPKNVSYEDTFVREVVKLFDALRDPCNPMGNYSQFLPATFLSFQMAQDCLLKRSVQLSCRNTLQPRLLLDINNLRSDTISTARISHKPVSHQTSPYNSPPHQSPHQSPRHFRKENTPILNFTYCSPQKLRDVRTPVHARDNSTETAEIKHATKLSLKNTVVKPTHVLEPSREFTSTMPNSIRNSGVFQRQVIVEKLDPTPAISRKNSTCNLKREENVLKHAAQRYSEVDQYPMSLQQNSKTKPLKISLENQTNLNQNYENSRQVSQNASYVAQTDEQRHTTFQQMRAANQSGPTLNDPPRRQFQSHKRHQTDFNLLSKMRGSESSHNQISMVQGNYLSKFNLNTIKSIHLLEEDRQLDREIIVDLKQIINKYRKLG